MTRVERIAELNGLFRKSGFGIMTTPGVRGLGDLPGLFLSVRQFKDFSVDNDPYGEHDFGCIVWMGQKVFWKIDYYDQDLTYFEDPLSHDCRRVLTVILASEY